MDERIANIVESLYDIGKVTGVHEILRGYCNRNFRVLTRKRKGLSAFLVRQYRPASTPNEICFEHRLITYARERGMGICARLIKSRDGGTYVQPEGGGIWAVFEFLPGEDRYTWRATDLTDMEFENAGRVLADYHHAVRDFDPCGFEREEAPILELWMSMRGDFERLGQEAREGIFCSFFRSHLDAILEVIGANTLDPNETLGFPVIPAHYDFHPGNLKWREGRVVGLFDFDWAKMDLRLFDICMALVYCCSHWGGTADGDLRLDKLSLFVKSYQHRLGTRDASRVISGKEQALLPNMLAIANVYLIHWEVVDYFDIGATNDTQYLSYLQHSVRLMQWLETHRTEIKHAVATALT